MSRECYQNTDVRVFLGHQNKSWIRPIIHYSLFIFLLVCCILEIMVSHGEDGCQGILTTTDNRSVNLWGTITLNPRLLGENYQIYPFWPYGDQNQMWQTNLSPQRPLFWLVVMVMKRHLFKTWNCRWCLVYFKHQNFLPLKISSKALRPWQTKWDCAIRPASLSDSKRLISCFANQCIVFIAIVIVFDYDSLFHMFYI